MPLLAPGALLVPVPGRDDSKEPYRHMAISGSRSSQRTDRVLGIAVRVMAGVLVAVVAVYAFTVLSDRRRDYRLSPAGRLEAAAREEVRKNPSSPGARVNLAALYVQLLRHDEAIRAADEALRLKADYAPAFLVRGLAWMNKEDDARALPDFQRAITLMKDQPMARENQALDQAYFYSGVIYYRRKDYDKALQHLKAAASINRTSSDTLYFMGEAYLKKGATDLALKSLNDAISFDPKFVPAQYALGQAYEKVKQLTLAAEHYRLAVEHSESKYPDAVAALKRLGTAEEHYEAGRKLISGGKLDEGVKKLELALAIDPLFVNANFALGRAYERQGQQADKASERKLRLDLARGMYVRVKDLSPSYPGIKEALARVERALAAKGPEAGER